MSSLRDTLQAIYNDRGLLTPEVVVDEARDEAHPLHHRFEWNDAVAGEAYRREQAAGLIRSVKVRYGDPRKGPRDVRAFIAMPQDDSRSQSYEPVEKVLADPLTRAIVLRDMEREWKQFKARYAHMAEFAELLRSALESEAA